MINSIKKNLNNNYWAILFLFIFLFILIRIPGLDSPLHQDEYKWPMIVSPDWQSDIAIPHPPLSQFIYKTAGSIVGFDVDFRFVPLFFGSINLILLFYFLNRFFGRKEAIVGSVIWVFSYFSVLASLMVDTDGQIIPFFFLLCLISYFHLKYGENKKRIWITLLVISAVLGFFVKVSFLLSILAIIADYLWDKRNYFTKKQYLLFVLYFSGGLVVLGVLLFLSKIIFPFFNIDQTLSYWKHFLVLDRGWMQTGIQIIKAILFMSPLILIPIFYIKSLWNTTRVFIFFLLFAFIFYVALFDFSIGALDRYLQLLILPITVMSSIVISNLISHRNNRFKEFLFLGIITALFIFMIQSVNHYVPPLHPKTEWVDRILSFKWNFLYPFSGGSGPLGFYVSFAFLGLSFITSFIALVVSNFRENIKDNLVVFILPIIFVYNIVFISEYLFGFRNGSAPDLLRDAVVFIENNPDIKMVTVYNDNGGDEIQKIGKYRKRLYVDPKFDVNEKVQTLNQYKEHYFVLNVPRLDPKSVYQRYFDSCVVIYNEKDKYIYATVYDCTKVPDLKNE